MPSFSATSQANLAECAMNLQTLFNEVIRNYDCSIIEGWRSNVEQARLQARGLSKLGPGESKHNSRPSRAVDAVPYPVIWPKARPRTAEEWSDYTNAVARFYHFAGYVLGVATKLGIHVRWGGDWDGDREFTDQQFHDLPHFELI